MHLRFPRGSLAKSIILSLIGLVLTYFTRRTPSRPFIVVMDALFNVGMVFFIYGLMHAISNMDMFASLRYGFQAIKRVFQGNPQKASEMKEDYLEYRSSRARHDDVPFLLIIAFVLMAASVALYLIAG